MAAPPSITVSDGDGGAMKHSTSSNDIVKEGDIRVERTLSLRIGEAKSLKPTIMLVEMDAYVVVGGVGGGQTARTTTVFKETNPFWGEEFEFRIDENFEGLTLEVWDHHVLLNDMIVGEVKIPSSIICHDDDPHEQWYSISPLSKEEEDDFVSGQLNCKIRYYPPEGIIPGKLEITALSARDLAAKDSNGLSDPYVKFKLGNEKQKTKVHPKTLNPNFNESFSFNLVGDDYPKELLISIWDKDLMSANDFMGAVCVYLEELEPGYEYNQWFQLGHVAVEMEDDESGVASEDVGSLRLKFKYTEEQILSDNTYENLVELLKEDNFAAIRYVGAVTKERNECALRAIRVMEADHYRTAVELLQALNDEEILATSTASVIFRGNTIATKANDMYMKLVGRRYLMSTLHSIIHKIYGLPDAVEVDPTRLKDPADLQKNWETLKELVSVVFDAIVGSIDACPTMLREVFAHLQETVWAAFPDDMTIQYTVVAGFIFLRFFCAAILGPKLFDLAPEHPNEYQARTLTLVAKTIQNLANLVEFQGKEPYMHEMNSFILANMERVKIFIDDLSTRVDDFVPHEASMIDKAREAAALIHFFVESRADIESKLAAQDNAAVRKVLEEIDVIEAKRKAAKPLVSKQIKQRRLTHVEKPGTPTGRNTTPHNSGAANIPPVPGTPTAAGGAAGGGGGGGGQGASASAAGAHGGETDIEARKENMKKILDIQANLSKCDIKKNLASRDRVFIREGTLVKSSKGKDQARTFYLFNDILLYGEVKKGKMQINFKGLIAVEDFVVVDTSQTYGEDGPSSSGAAHPERATIIELVNLSKKKVISLKCGSEDERAAWLKDLAAVRLNKPGKEEAKKIVGDSFQEYAGAGPSSSS